MKKLLIYGGGGIVVIVIVAVVGVFFFAGDAIKTAVEKMGPKLTKAEVTLAKVDLSLTSGEAELSGLLIGNPQGFTTSHAFKLGNIKVKIDTGTIGKDTIVINEILIDAPDVIAEFKKFSFNPLKASASIQESLQTSNFIAIQKNVNSYVKEQGGGSGGGSKPAAKSESSGAKQDGPKLIIEKFRMNNVKVRAVAQAGLKLDQSIPPFSIALNNIGKKEGGLAPEKIAAVLIPEVQNAVTKAITGDLIKSATDMVGKMGDAAKDALKSVTGGASKMGENLSKGVGNVGKTVTEGAKGATDAIKGLFGK